jgi:PAS domain S-box-containing protein
MSRNGQGALRLAPADPPPAAAPAAWTGGLARLLLDSLPAMTAILDERGCIVAANEAWRRFGRENGAGPTVAEGVGQSYLAICRDGAMAGCPRDERAETGVRRVLRGELPIFTCDYASEGLPEQRWFMLTATPLAGGGAVVTQTDITARRRTEMSAAALIKTGRELAAGLEPDDVAQQIVTSVVRVFGARCSALYRLDRDQARLVCIAAAGGDDGRKDWIGRALMVGEGTAGRAAAEERCVWTPDVLADAKIDLPDWAADLVSDADFRSVLAMPLKANDRVIGVLGLGDVAGRAYTGDELALLAAFVGQGAVALENSGLYREIRDARDFLQSITENSPDAIITSDVEGRVTYVSRGAEALFGYRADEIIGTPVAAFYPGGLEEARAIKRRLARENGQLRNYETGFITRDGGRVEVSASISLLRDPSGAVVGTLGMLKDIGERLQLEAQLRQSQKMDAIGRLAGGIAHDFNNLLTVITGRAQLIASRLRPEEPIHRDATLVRTTADRAATLTQQLLAFSRKQMLQPQVLNLNVVVTGMEPMLRRLIGEDIELAVTPREGPGRVKADRGQIEQVIVNLVVNSRDAMPEGGRLTIETDDVELNDAEASRQSVPAGPYVALAVSDTGAGMDEETRSRVFEPFFTTKGPGKGTGLGLATVYGIVKQSGGDIQLASEPGTGTTFTIYLPRVPEAATEEDETISTVGAMPRGDETVLLVEDEPEVRDLAREILEGSGYTVLRACDAQDALLMAERHPGPIQLLLTDVIMPKQSGRALVERLRPLRPEMQVLYMSGYTNEAIVRHGVLDPDTLFIQKPFTPLGLGQKVRAALDQIATA